MITDNPFRQFVKKRTVSLRTRKRDGSWVATPVNIVVEDDHAYVRTYDSSGKSKRLRNFAEVEIAPSTVQGRATGLYVGGFARLLTGDEARHASELLSRKYPLIHGVLVPLFHRLKRQTTEHYRITPRREP
jgi:PPOX class probable F420-dependent enzyme